MQFMCFYLGCCPGSTLMMCAVFQLSGTEKSYTELVAEYNKVISTTANINSRVRRHCTLSLPPLSSPSIHTATTHLSPRV